MVFVFRIFCLLLPWFHIIVLVFRMEKSLIASFSHPVACENGQKVMEEKKRKKKQTK
jgi:hypothetical protein